MFLLLNSFMIVNQSDINKYVKIAKKIQNSFSIYLKTIEHFHVNKSEIDLY